MEPTFQHMMRVLNTNIDGRERVYIALTAIRGVGRRFADVICKKAEVDRYKRSVGAAPPPLRPPRARGLTEPRRASPRRCAAPPAPAS